MGVSVYIAKRGEQIKMENVRDYDYVFQHEGTRLSNNPRFKILKRPNEEQTVCTSDIIELLKSRVL